MCVCSSNTRRYFSWLVSGARDKRGRYSVQQQPSSPVVEELRKTNGIPMKTVVTTEQGMSELPKANGRHQSDNYESESDAETLDRTQDLEVAEPEVHETEVAAVS